MHILLKTLTDGQVPEPLRTTITTVAGQPFQLVTHDDSTQEKWLHPNKSRTEKQ